MVKLKKLFGKHKHKAGDGGDEKEPRDGTAQTSEIDVDDDDNSTITPPSSKENEVQEPFEFPKRKKFNRASSKGKKKKKKSIFGDSDEDEDDDDENDVFGGYRGKKSEEESADKVSDGVIEDRLATGGRNGDDAETTQSSQGASDKKKKKKHKKKKKNGEDESVGGKSKDRRNGMKCRTKSGRSLKTEQDIPEEEAFHDTAEPTTRQQQQQTHRHEDGDDDSTSYTSLGFNSIFVDNPPPSSALSLGALGSIQWKQALMTIPNTLHSMIFPRSSAPNYVMVETLRPHLHHIDEATDELKKQVRSVVRLSRGGDLDDDNDDSSHGNIPLEAERALEMINLTHLPPHEQEKFIKLLLEQERVRLMKTLDQLQQIQIDLKSTLEDMATK